MNKTYDVYAIGNALVDFLVEVDDALLEELELVKGQFALVDNEKSKEILDKIKFVNAKICSGGSAANTVATMSILGSKVAFFSKVGGDEYGKLHENETKTAGAEVKGISGDVVTGHCIVFMTPDAERTFVVNYGAATHVNPSEIKEEDIAASKIVHIEGYMLTDPNLKKVAVHAMELAKKHEVRVSFDLNDAGVIAQHKEQILEWLKTYVDIVFANEEEALALTGKKAADAVQELGELCSIAIVKMGGNGSLIVENGAVTSIDALPASVIDTTGAGDAYAAGFLHGLANGMTIEEGGLLASQLGAKVVSQVGARLGTDVINEFS
jgi:sugar/nucleoside kinase (ribokinase family)